MKRSICFTIIGFLMILCTPYVALGNALDVQISPPADWQFSPLAEGNSFLGSPSTTGLIGYLAPLSPEKHVYSPSLLVFDVDFSEAEWDLANFIQWIQQVKKDKYMSRMSAGKIQSLATSGQMIYFATFQTFERKNTREKSLTIVFYAIKTGQKIIVLSYQNYSRYFSKYSSQILEVVKKTRITSGSTH